MPARLCLAATPPPEKNTPHTHTYTWKRMPLSAMSFYIFFSFLGERETDVYRIRRYMFFRIREGYYVETEG